ncbi:MAG: aldo/keto reductase [Sphingomonadaceae bacterium]
MSMLPHPNPRRLLGNSSIEASAIAWGMWRTADDGLDARGLSTLVHSALDAGIDLHDTADIYGFDGKGGFGDAEALLGEVLHAEPGLRQRIVLATKGGVRPPLPYDQSSDYMGDALEASLKRLGVEHIDLYQVHRPDILTHPQELARFLDDALASGKVRAIGVSNFTIHQIDALTGLLGAPLATTQPEISPLRIEPFDNGEMDQAMRLRLAPLAWSPLGGGRLMRPTTPHEQAVAAALDHAAEEAGVSRAVATYSWLMAHPARIVPIVGSQKPERIVEAAQALTMRWTREAWYKVFAAARGAPLP